MKKEEHNAEAVKEAEKALAALGFPDVTMEHLEQYHLDLAPALLVVSMQSEAGAPPETHILLLAWDQSGAKQDMVLQNMAAIVSGPELALSNMTIALEEKSTLSFVSADGPDVQSLLVHLPGIEQPVALPIDHGIFSSADATRQVSRWDEPTWQTVSGADGSLFSMQVVGFGRAKNLSLQSFVDTVQVIADTANGIDYAAMPLAA